MTRIHEFLTIRLRDVNKLSEYSPQARQAALIFRDHARRRQAARPGTGPYYWAPYPSSRKGRFTWKLLAFSDSEGFGTGHSSFLMHQGKAWGMVRRLLQDWWGLKTSQLSQLARVYTGLPRGRVTQSMASRGGVRWLILHGNNSPVSNAERQIISAFNLPPDKTEAVFDVHEQAFEKEAKKVQSVLGLSWKVPKLDLGDCEN